MDIHLVLEGEEIINIAETSTMKPTMDFDLENDYCLFEGKKQHTVRLRKGEFLALYPNECHQTAVKIELKRPIPAELTATESAHRPDQIELIDQ